MNNIKIFKGYWFIPSRPEYKVAGILEVEGYKTFSLDLIGGFKNDLKDLLDSSNFEDVIFGSVYNEEAHLREVTLFECNSSFSSNFSAEYPLTNYKCQYFIDGMHLESKDTKAFYKMCSHLTNLYNWKPAGIIRQSFIYPKEDVTCELGKIELDIKTKDNWEIPVEIENGLSVILYGSVSYKPEPNYKNIKIGQNTLLRFEADKNLSITDFLRKLELYRQFVSLGTLTNISYEKIYLYDRQNFQKLSKGGKAENPIYLYFCFWEHEEEGTKFNRQNVIFLYSDIEAEYLNIIKKWYSSGGEFVPIRDHLIDSISSNKTFTKKDFLILIQALEGYHRRFIKEKGHLEQRLEFLVNNKFKDILKINRITNEDIDIIKDSRHYFSHFQKDKKKAVDGAELYNLSAKLRNLLICCVLSLVGFTNEKINELLNKNQNL
jgi:hypothetical protein